jgi:hypothetical protein
MRELPPVTHPIPQRDPTRHASPLIHGRVSLRRIAGPRVAHYPVDASP